MGFKKFSAQRLINQYKFTRNRTSASGFLPMPNLPYHPITREASAAHKEIIKLRLLERVDVRSQESISERCRIAFHAAEPSPARFAPLCLQTGKGNITRSATVADNACCGGAGSDRTAALPAERVWVRRPFAQPFRAPFLRGKAACPMDGSPFAQRRTPGR